MVSGWMLGIGLISFIGALVLALVLTPLVKKLAVRIGAIDVPNQRKVHTRIMPRLGGVAIYAAFTVGLLLILPWVPEGTLSTHDSNLISALLVGAR